MEARAPSPPFPVNLPGSEAPAPPLPPTQFEQLYGELALRIIAGITTIDSANNEERRVLDDIARKMALSKPKPQQPAATLPVRDVRPPHVRSQEEMETFTEEYQPLPKDRDWPISPDHPEGQQD